MLVSLINKNTTLAERKAEIVPIPQDRQTNRLSRYMCISSPQHGVSRGSTKWTQLLAVLQGAGDNIQRVLSDLQKNKIK